MDNVVFYKKNVTCCYKYKGQEFILNNKNLLALKKKVIYPANFVFNDISLGKVKEILNYFNHWNINIEIRELDNDNKNKYLAILDKNYDDIIIPAYRITDLNVLYKVNASPYVLFKDNVTKLLEVDKENVLKDNCSEYYYIEDELDNSEKQLLKDNYVILHVNCIYKYHPSMYNYRVSKKLEKKIN